MRQNTTTDNVITILRDEISIEEVASRLGVITQFNLAKSGTNLIGECITGHPSQSRRCMSIALDKNFWYCFHCGAGGSTIDLVMAVQGADFKGAITHLAREHRPEMLPVIEESRYQVSVEDREYFQKAILFEEIFTYGKRLLSQPEAQAAMDYLLARGYTADVVRQTQWIYWPMEAEIRSHLEQAFPTRKADIESLTLGGGFGDHFRLALPYRDTKGRISGFLKRHTSKAGYQDHRWDSTKGLQKKNLYGLDRAVAEQGSLLIVEGYPDAEYLFALGLKNITALGQGRFSESYIGGLKAKGIRSIILSLDNDGGTGAENTEKAVQLLPNSGISVYVVDPPALGAHKDPDELVAAEGLAKFQEIAANAESAARWLTRRIIGRHDVGTDRGRDLAIAESLAYELAAHDALATKDVLDTLASSLGIPMELLKPHVEQAKEEHARRVYQEEMKQLAQRASGMAEQGDIDALEELLLERPREVHSAYATAVAPQVPLEKFLEQKRLADMQRTPGKLMGLALNRFQEVARHLDGLQPGLHLVHAYANVGKTAYATCMAVDILATNPGSRVLFYSLDDRCDIIINRILALLTGLEINDVRRPQQDAKRVRLLNDAYRKIGEWSEARRLIVRDSSDTMGFETIEADIESAGAGSRTVVVVDALYNLRSTKEQFVGIREENIGRAQRLKDLSVSQGCPVLATGELRKKQDSALGGYTPTMHDIMETGKYAYAADVIWLLYPEDDKVYDQVDDPVMVLKFDKNKQSSYRQSVTLRFERRRSTMTEVPTASFVDRF